MHEDNCFINPTYEKAPYGLVPVDLQRFWKRLRRSLGKQRISYLACGEYGERSGRPHYHACVFGLWPDDAVLHRRGEHPLYRSAWLERIWGHGHIPFGSVTFESAMYVAGYIAKKITGPGAKDHYQVEHIDVETGEVTWDPVEPEFCVSSRNPAVGLRWLKRHGDSDAWRHDEVIVRGAPQRLPKYYDRQLKRVATERERKQLTIKRLQKANTPRARREGTPERLAVQEVVLRSNLKLKARDQQ